MLDFRRRSRHLVPLAAVQAVGLGCGIVGVRWSSSLIPPEILGAYGLLLSTQLFGASVTHQGFIQHVQRHWTARMPARPYLRQLRGALARPTLLLVAGLTAVLFLLKLGAGPAIGAAWLPWLVAVNLLVVAGHLLHAALQAEEQYWAHFALSAIGSVTRSFLPLLFVVAAGAARLPVLGAGYLLHTLLWAWFGVCLLYPAWRRPASALPDDVVPPARLVNAFLGVGICAWLAGVAPRWFAALVLTPEATGYFMLAMNLASIIPAAVSLIGLSFTFPPLFAASRRGASAAAMLRSTDRIVLLALGAGQVALLALAWCGPALIGTVVTARYASSLDWLLAAGGGALAAISGPFYCNLLLARNQEKACLWLTAGSAAFRLCGLAGLALAKNPDVFRIGLILLPWPTVALEWFLVRRWLDRRPAAQT